MSTINVRTHKGYGGRATCPCGWVYTSTKKDAFLWAVQHNETNHGDNYNIHVAFTIHGEEPE